MQSAAGGEMHLRCVARESTSSRKMMALPSCSVCRRVLDLLMTAQVLGEATDTQRGRLI